MSRLTLSAWGTKRIADMTREELIDALTEADRSYRLIARQTMSGPDVKLPEMNMQQADEIFDKVARIEF